MDTKKITVEILETGLTQQQLATLLACSQSTISSFVSGARGSCITKSLGDRLAQIHKKRCRSTRSTASP